MSGARITSRRRPRRALEATIEPRGGETRRRGGRTRLCRPARHRAVIIGLPSRVYSAPRPSRSWIRAPESSQPNVNRPTYGYITIVFIYCFVNLFILIDLFFIYLFISVSQLAPSLGIRHAGKRVTRDRTRAVPAATGQRLKSAERHRRTAPRALLAGAPASILLTLTPDSILGPLRYATSPLGCLPMYTLYNVCVCTYIYVQPHVIPVLYGACAHTDRPASVPPPSPLSRHYDPSLFFSLPTAASSLPPHRRSQCRGSGRAVKTRAYLSHPLTGFRLTSLNERSIFI